MKTCAVRYSLTILVIIVCLVSSCSKKPSEPHFLPNLFGAVVYVAPGGTGDGSKGNPLGSIQTAIEQLERSPTSRVVVVASGEFNESIRVRGDIHIYGSRNPGDNWNLSDSNTVIYTADADPSASVCGMIVSQAKSVILDHLHLISGEAASVGQSSYGVVFDSCESVKVVGCYIRAGLGASGLVGLAGQSGIDGDAGIPIFSWEDKENAGLNPIRGGHGGKGGAKPGLPCTGPPIVGAPGARGYCETGDSSGGTGGQPNMNGSDGQAGAAGEGGKGGLFGSQLKKIAGNYLFTGDIGDSGKSGQFGCGGGGGGGLYGWCDSYNSYAGGWGGGGGAGAGPGTGGFGGHPGGSSIGILVVCGALILENTMIIADAGGAGGRGGAGGIGGKGGAGGSTYNFPGVTLGGKGGNGGTGGEGGGGAGGASAAIVTYSATVQFDSETSFAISSGGIGGGSVSTKGQDGPASAFVEAK